MYFVRIRIRGDGAMRNVMVDIETLGQSAGCVILSVAAIRFDLETGEMEEEFYEKISLESSLAIGLEVEADTLGWWAMQDADLFREALSGNSHISVVLGKLSSFVNKTDWIWAKSPLFDLSILREAYKRCGLPVPWRFTNTRDVRTIVALWPPVAKKVVGRWATHHPLSDCKDQIAMVSHNWEIAHKNVSKNHDRTSSTTIRGEPPKKQARKA